MKKQQRDNKDASSAMRDEQARRQRLIRLVVIPLAAIIIIAGIGIGIWSYINAQVKPFRETAIRVNDVTFDMGYYINMMDIYYGKVSVTDLSDYADYAELEIDQFSVYIEDQIVRNELIKQGSALRGIEVDREAIKDELKDIDLPVTDEYIDIYTSKELMDLQVPPEQVQVHPQIMLLESESAARDALSRLQQGESFEQIAVSDSRFAANSDNGDLGWITASEVDILVGTSALGDVLLAADPGIGGPVYDDSVTKEYGYWVMKVIEKEEADASENTSARVQVQALLLGSEEEAASVIEKLNAGEDADELAKQYSQVTNADQNGVTVVWLTQSDEMSAFNPLFSLSVGDVSQPIGDNQTETTGGYWVFNIVEKDENRELTAQQLSSLREAEMEKFALELNDNGTLDLESLLTEETRFFAINEVLGLQGKGSVMIRNASLPDGESGIPYTAQMEAYGEQKGIVWSITEGGLPKGLSMDTSTGVISGTPEFAGASSLTIKVSSSTHHWTQEFVLRVHIPVRISTESLPDGRVGESYVTTLEVFGDSNMYSWTVIEGEIPEGLELYSSSGRLSGTPVTAGTYSFIVQVDDGYATDSAEFTLVIGEEEVTEGE